MSQIHELIAHYSTLSWVKQTITRRSVHIYFMLEFSLHKSQAPQTAHEYLGGKQASEISIALMDCDR